MFFITGVKIRVLKFRIVVSFDKKQQLHFLQFVSSNAFNTNATAFGVKTYREQLLKSTSRYIFLSAIATLKTLEQTFREILSYFMLLCSKYNFILKKQQKMILSK